MRPGPVFDEREVVASSPAASAVQSTLRDAARVAATDERLLGVRGRAEPQLAGVVRRVLLVGVEVAAHRLQRRRGSPASSASGRARAAVEHAARELGDRARARAPRASARRARARWSWCSRRAAGARPRRSVAVTVADDGGLVRRREQIGEQLRAHRLRRARASRRARAGAPSRRSDTRRARSRPRAAARRARATSTPVAASAVSAAAASETWYGVLRRDRCAARRRRRDAASRASASSAFACFVT